MTKKEAIVIAAPYFESHNVDVLFITSDKLAFFKDGEAANHARTTLKDSHVVKVYKNDTVDEAVETEGEFKTHLEKIAAAQHAITELDAKKMSALHKLDEAADKDKAAFQLAIDEIAEEMTDAYMHLAELEAENK